MKRGSTLFAVLALALSIVLVAAGCGASGDKEKAKEYMAAADAGFEKLEAQSEELGELIEDSLTELMTAMATGQAPDPQKINDAVDKIKSAADDMLAMADQVTADYGMILTLTGVDDYASYAELMISANEGSAEALTTVLDYLEKLAKGLADGSLQPDQISETMMEFASEMDVLQKEIDSLEKEAEKLKKDKSL